MYNKEYNKDDEVEVTTTKGENKFYKGEHGKVHAHIPKTRHYMVQLKERIGFVFIRSDALKPLKCASNASGAFGKKKGASRKNKK